MRLSPTLQEPQTGHLVAVIYTQTPNEVHLDAVKMAPFIQHMRMQVADGRTSNLPLMNRLGFSRMMCKITNL